MILLALCMFLLENCVDPSDVYFRSSGVLTCFILDLLGSNPVGEVWWVAKQFRCGKM